MAAQPTAQGQIIKALSRIGRKLYIGYGDLNANTGPIHALALDLDTQTVVDEATLTTEETGRYRQYGGKVYTAFRDPQGGIGNPENGSYAVLTDGQWAKVTLTPYAEHCFDVLETADGIFACGLAELVAGDTNNQSQVWHSTDGGATWASEVAVPTDDTTWVQELFPFSSGKIVAYQPDYNIYCWDGTAWSIIGTYDVNNTRDIPEVGDTQLFTLNGVEVYLGRFGVVVEPGTALDPETAYAAFDCGNAHLLDASEDGAHLYVLTYGGDVVRYAQDATHSIILTGQDTGSQSFAVDEVGGYVYFGTSDSRILRTEIPS